MIPSTHHGAWKGENRLWFEDPEQPERSDGALDVAETSIEYTWSFRGATQRGEIALSGPKGALRADWKDSWHAADGMTLHGRFAEHVLKLYTTYSAGDGPVWGWRIEIDLRDPEHCTLRMFNLMPDGTIAPAVDLRGGR